jgi:hypothetical protein
MPEDEVFPQERYALITKNITMMVDDCQDADDHTKVTWLVGALRTNDRNDSVETGTSDAR